MLTSIYKWQSLIGSFIGAATPITFWFFVKWLERRKKLKDDLYYLEKLLVFNINLVADIHKTINSFVDDRIKYLTDNIQDNIDNKSYSLDVAFFPLFLSKSVDKNMLRLNTYSSYLDNKLNQIQYISENFSESINDLRLQFREMIKNNRIMVIERLNDPSAQASMYKKNIEDFVQIAKKDLLETNALVYLGILVRTRVAASFYRKVGSLRWQLKFSSYYKFFWNKKKYTESIDGIYDNIDKYFEKKVDIEIDKILTQFGISKNKK